MKIIIKKPGLLSTVQDLGRRDYLGQAVPFSGAMDSLSAQIANKALGNSDDCALIEFTQSGAAFFAESDMLIALSGGGSFLNAGGRRLPSDRPVFVPASTNLYLENNPSGCRSYLAVAGGWDVPEILGSRSTFVTVKTGGFEGRPLAGNDRLANTGSLSLLSEAICNSLQGGDINYSRWCIAREILLPSRGDTIRVMKGREFNWFDEASANEFLSQPFAAGNNGNRMGIHLHGGIITRAAEGELLSTAVMPGTIQVSGGGSLILLMADCQTTGGYPRIAQVAAADLPLCAQLKPGDTVRFKEISWREAEKLYIQQQLDLHKISIGIRQKYDII